MGIINKVEQPTEWVNPIVVVRKPNGDVRICLDPVDLNKAVRENITPQKRWKRWLQVCSKQKFSQLLMLHKDSTRSSWSKKVLGILRSTHPLADLNLRDCHLVWYQPQTFVKGPCLRCLRTLRNVKLLWE